jgi:hypothetical protein
MVKLKYSIFLKNRMFRRRKQYKSKDSRGGSKKKTFLKVLRIFLLFSVSLTVIYWVFNAYRTISEVKIVDVVAESTEVVHLVELNKVKRTLIVYQDEEDANLFILAVIYNTDTSEALMYYFPRTLYIEDHFGGQYFSVNNLTYAGYSYMYKDKHAYVVRQIQEQMAMKFDSYVWIGHDVAKHFFSDDERWGYNKEDVFTIFSRLSFFNLIPRYRNVNMLHESLHSNMNFLDMYSYFQSIRGVIYSKSCKFIDLGEKSMSKSIVLGSGQTGRALDLQALDKSLDDNYSILRGKDLSREHAKVEVYNGTDIPMYARIMGRKIQNSGCNVIRNENSSTRYTQNYIYIPQKEQYTNALKVVQSIVEDAVIVEGRPDFLTTGDIIVVLGDEKE